MRFSSLSGSTSLCNPSFQFKDYRLNKKAHLNSAHIHRGKLISESVIMFELSLTRGENQILCETFL